MPKKPQQSTETGNHALSREDRKNEQICRMIERAEKQRLKREEKKKLAVLNKVAGNKPCGPVGRKSKKLINLLSPKRTQVAIHIMFSDKVRQQNASNRYFFERKQTIEEKQRLEQEELWARFARMQHQHQQSLYQPATAQVSGLGSQAAFYGQAQGVPSGLGAGTGVPQPQYYLNAGETGGNYEANLEDASGSSYFSSASKKLTAHQLQSYQQQPLQNTDLLSLPTDQAPLHPLLAPAGHQPRLNSVLNDIAIEQSNTQGPSDAPEERKQPSAAPSQKPLGVTINVNLTGSLKDGDGRGKADGDKEGRSVNGAELSTGTSVRLQKQKLTDTHRADEAAAPVAKAVSQEDQILALTRQQMSGSKEQQRP